MCGTFADCPYDASPIEAEAYPNGSTLLSCRTCGAAWAMRKASLQRVREPDPEVLRRMRGRDPPPVSSSVRVADAEAAIRRVRASILSITRGTNETPPTPA